MASTPNRHRSWPDVTHSPVFESLKLAHVDGDLYSYESLDGIAMGDEQKSHVILILPEGQEGDLRVTIDQCEEIWRRFCTDRDELLRASIAKWSEMLAAHESLTSTECLERAEQFVSLMRVGVVTLGPQVGPSQRCWIWVCAYLDPNSEVSSTFDGFVQGRMIEVQFRDWKVLGTSFRG